MKYAELLEMPLADVRQYAAENPNHIGAQNAIRALELQEKHRKASKRMGQKLATVSGWTRHRPLRGRCPRTRDLR